MLQERSSRKERKGEPQKAAKISGDHEEIFTGTDPEVMARAILENLYHVQGRVPGLATDNDWYMALAHTVRDRMMSPFETQVRLVMSGQYTNDPLLPAEQFGLGGPDSVRGYQLRALTGDRGYNGQAEFYSPDVGRAFGFESVGIRALVFYDWGKVSRLEAQPGELSADRVSSVGGGVRVGMTRTWCLRADYVHVLNPANVGTTDLWRRFNFSFVALF